jgi:hypothetical protein
VAYVRKPGVDYSDVIDATASGDAATSTTAAPVGAPPPAGTTSELGP